MHCPVSHWDEKFRYMHEVHADNLGTHPGYLDYRIDDLRRRSLLVREEFASALAMHGMHRSPDVTGYPLGYRMVMPTIVRKHLEQLLCLQGDAQVSLPDLGRNEMSIRTYHDHPVLRLYMMRQLHRLGLLRFPKSWCWKVDRNAAEYDQRFGFSMLEMLNAFTEMDGEDDVRRVLLEWGAGNGNFKSQAERRLGSQYTCFAVSDAIYIPPEKLAASLVDTRLLAEDIGGAFDPAAFAEFVTLVTLQRPGTYDTDAPQMDPEVMTDLEESLEMFIYHLRRKAALLPGVDCVREPSGAARDGAVVYPQRRCKDASPNLAAACDAFACAPDRYLAAGNLESILANAPAHIAGMLPATFESVPGKLSAGSVNVSLAVRSTEYVPAEQYVAFQADVARALAEHGIAIDDSVRRNYGAGNRFAELRQVEQRVGFPLHVILGPGQTGEDRHGEPVPHAYVMTRDARKVALIAASLFDGYLMRPLSAMQA